MMLLIEKPVMVFQIIAIRHYEFPLAAPLLRKPCFDLHLKRRKVLIDLSDIIWSIRGFFLGV